MPDFGRRPWSTRLARALRARLTPEELRLWICLSDGFHWKFRRQEPIGPYICDFVCYPKRLIVEVDGAQHADSTRDARRDAYLGSLGFEVLRFWNGEVERELEVVLDTIAAALEARPDLHRNREPRRSQR